ncbi:hypothetical protein AB1Y20_011038 [Prymnesium parvum]|uniref:Mitochondrial import receptor subunit TOM40 n=1 Tax=Prymnesium parvum TaxID=97485 RepID=A0AB34INE8_PRYPA
MVGFFRSSLPNPGRYEELKAQAQQILSPDIFDGARFEFNKSLTPKFGVLHNVSMGGLQGGGAYEFGANYGEDRLLLASRVDMAGRLNGRVNAHLTDALLLRVQSQLGPDTAPTFKADLDWKGSDNTKSAYYMGGGLLGCHYMKSVTQHLALGAEAFYHMQNAKVYGGAGAARLTWGAAGENVATAKLGTFGHGAVELAYSRKVSPKVGLATELSYYHNQMCQFGLGYEFALQKATFKGTIQSDTTCSAALEERISPGVNLLLSAALNHKKKDYKFGVGIVIGQ